MSVLLPPTGHVNQGSVLNDLPWRLENAPLGIALTNACDLEHDKADFVTLAALKPAKAIIQSSREFRNKVEEADGARIGRKAWNSLAVLVRDFIHNASIRRYYLLDPRSQLEIDLVLVDFQHLISIPIEHARGLPQVAVLPSPDRENLVVHYAAYSSRVGVFRQPDDQVTELTELLTEPYRSA